MSNNTLQLFVTGKRKNSYFSRLTAEMNQSVQSQIDQADKVDRDHSDKIEIPYVDTKQVFS